jgi:hypothetical protein
MLSATMTRLDVEAEQAKQVRRGFPLRMMHAGSLRTFPTFGQQPTLTIARCWPGPLFERIGVLGVDQVRICPTREALEHGWLAAWQGKTLVVPLDAQTVRCGRGERARASGTRQIRGCAVSMGGRQGPVDLILTA